MLYLARLRVPMNGRPKIYTDPKTLQKALKEYSKSDRQKQTPEVDVHASAPRGGLDEQD